MPELRCPHCQKVWPLEFCDTMLADDGHVFCPASPQYKEEDQAIFGSKGVVLFRDDGRSSDDCGCGQEFEIESAIVRAGQLEMF